MLLVSGAVYAYLNTHIYSKLPSKVDMSESQFTGTWVSAGTGIKYDDEEFGYYNIKMFTKDEVEEAFDQKKSIETEDADTLFTNKYYLYDNGRAIQEFVDLGLQNGNWEETDDGIIYKPFPIKTTYNEPVSFHLREKVEGLTPQDLGYSGDYLLYVERVSPEDFNPYPFYIYAME